MTQDIIRSSLVALLMTALSCPAFTADLMRGPGLSPVDADRTPYAGQALKISGRPSVIDGRTLWFPEDGQKIRLASIDACELPQWSYDPRRHGDSAIPKPVPCGPLAKAWLKRMVGSARVSCVVRGYDADGGFLGRCTVHGRDLAIDMLRVGWARATLPAPPVYEAWQDRAKTARYGMWATYVLDMNEWRAKAVDQTLARRPIADFNLLAERESEISPPFKNARKRPKRTDR